MAILSLRMSTVQGELTAATFSGEAAKKFVERIVDDLHAAGIVTKAVDGFYDQMPDVAASPCVAVVDLGGVPNHTPAPDMLVQFLVRGATWAEARDKAAVIFNRYHTATNTDITGYHIQKAVAQGLPTHFGEDENQRHRVGFNMIFRAYSTNQGSSTVGFGGKRDPNEA